MPPRGLIERRDAHQAVHASFSGEQTVGVFAGELDRCGLEPGLFAGRFIQHRRVHALALCPAQVHAQQDGSPVLRLGAAGAGLDGHDGVEVIGLAGEQRTSLLFRDVALRSSQLVVKIFEQSFPLPRIGFFSSESDVGLDVAAQGGKFGIGRDLILGALAVAQDRLRRFLVVPEVRLGNAFFEGFQALAMLRRVKENSGRGRCAASSLRIDTGGLQESWA